MNLIDRVSIEECINFLRVHCSPLSYITSGKCFPPLVISDLNNVFENYCGFGNISKPVFTVTPSFFVIRVNWKNKRAGISVLLKLVAAS